MPLYQMGDMLRHAHQNRYAIGTLEVTDLDSLLGALDIAERTDSPLILALAIPAGEQRRLGPLAAAACRAAEETLVPVAIQGVRAPAPDAAARAVNLGCNAVGLAAGSAADPAHIARTREMVEMAHSCGTTAEGALCGPPDPAEASRFQAETGVDCLALDWSAPELQGLAELGAALALPLTLGPDARLDDAAIGHAIAYGVSRIQATDPARLTAARMTLWGCAGRATEVMARCRPQRTVEHVILYNLEGLDARGTRDMMAEGRRVLGGIPGVRRVFTGDAVQADAAYRHCWVVSFSDGAVIDSYREHPHHRAFADQRFRPYAGGRVSIDYTDTSR